MFGSIEFIGPNKAGAYPMVSSQSSFHTTNYSANFFWRRIMSDDKKCCIPFALGPPSIPDLNSGQLNIWVGTTLLQCPGISLSGVGRVYFDMLPFPEFRFEFNSDEHPLKQAFLYSTLSNWEMECGPPIGAIKCRVLSFKKNCSSGVPDQIPIQENETLYTNAKFLVINGPIVDGECIQLNGEPFQGRMTAEIGDCKVTVDPISRESQERRCLFKPTHVVECEFEQAKSLSYIDGLRDGLFRTLSLMKCHWVGLLGPWMTSTDTQAIGFRLSVTKTTRNGGTASWYHKSAGDCFAELAPRMFESFEDSKRGESLQTALHWLVEAEQCSGGIEGSIILQQSALECLAWLAIVVDRSICSVPGFKNLPAADKIRWLLSLHSIDYSIPEKCSSIQTYAKEYNLLDLVEVFVDVRNALVHAEPKKIEKLFSRKQGHDERNELWFQIGGLLHQAFLASVGYQGLLRRRDTDEYYAANAVTPSPWAPSTSED
jgi:hypothetical protein